MKFYQIFIGVFLIAICACKKDELVLPMIPEMPVLEGICHYGQTIKIYVVSTQDTTHVSKDTLYHSFNEAGKFSIFKFSRIEKDSLVYDGGELSVVYKIFEGSNVTKNKITNYTYLPNEKLLLRNSTFTNGPIITIENDSLIYDLDTLKQKITYKKTTTSIGDLDSLSLFSKTKYTYNSEGLLFTIEESIYDHNEILIRTTLKTFLEYSNLRNAGWKSTVPSHLEGSLNKYLFTKTITTSNGEIVGTQNITYNPRNINEYGYPVNSDFPMVCH